MTTLGMSLAISVPCSLSKPNLIAGGKEKESKVMLTCRIIWAPKDLDVSTTTRTEGRHDKKYEQLTRPSVASCQCSVRFKGYLKKRREKDKFRSDSRSRGQSTGRAAERDVGPHE